MRARLAAVMGVLVTLAFGGGVAVASSLRPGPDDVAYNLPSGPDGAINPDPFLASGVGIGQDVALYTASGTGPAPLNSGAAAGSPELYVDYSVLTELHPSFTPTEEDRAAGVLPPNVTITEAQGLNAMARVQENLASAGLTLADLVSMRIYQDSPPSAGTADFEGWNRAYRKFVANVDRVSGEVLPTYAPVVFENATRPTRVNLEVAGLPRPGWLVEIEVVAAFPA